jgi:hypothetical protein
MPSTPPVVTDKAPPVSYATSGPKTSTSWERQEDTARSPTRSPVVPFPVFRQCAGLKAPRPTTVGFDLMIPVLSPAQARFVAVAIMLMDAVSSLAMPALTGIVLPRPCAEKVGSPQHPSQHVPTFIRCAGDCSGCFAANCLRRGRVSESRRSRHAIVALVSLHIRSITSTDQKEE